MIPPIFSNANLEDFTENDLGSTDWIREKHLLVRDVFITGPNGIGKSHLAAALCKRWKGEWHSVRQVIRRIRGTFSRDAWETADDVVESLARSKLPVVLDDLTASHSTDFAWAVLLDVVAERVDREHPTIVTSHHSIADIHKHDTALASRLAGFHIVHLRGKDRRVGKDKKTWRLEDLKPRSKSELPAGQIPYADFKVDG